MATQGIKLFGKTITFKVNITQPIKNEEEDKQTLEPETTTAVRSSSSQDPMADKRPTKIIPCPRCKSMETKFCYFNNYNVNQPRHFCKSCHRYWTAGGALRNVPVGAGRRKSKPLGRDMLDGVHQVELINGLVIEEWKHVTDVVHGGFRHDFPVKRLRCYTDGQPC